MNELLNEKEAAQCLGCSVGLLRKWRLFGQGPDVIRVGRLRRYKKDDLLAFIEANRITRPEVR
jgi:helix-turn-helix protein